MSYVSISAKIKSILEALTDDDGEKLFSVVFDYPVDLTKEAVKTWPVAVVIETGSDSDYLSNRENFRTYNYEIHLLKNRKNSKDQIEWPEMRKLTDTVMDAFDDNWQLGNVVVNIHPVTATYGIDKTDANTGTWFASVVLLRCDLDRTNAS